MTQLTWCEACIGVSFISSAILCPVVALSWLYSSYFTTFWFKDLVLFLWHWATLTNCILLTIIFIAFQCLRLYRMHLENLMIRVNNDNNNTLYLPQLRKVRFFQPNRTWSFHFSRIANIPEWKSFPLNQTSELQLEPTSKYAAHCIACGDLRWQRQREAEIYYCSATTTLYLVTEQSHIYSRLGNEILTQRYGLLARRQNLGATVEYERCAFDRSLVKSSFPDREEMWHDRAKAHKLKETLYQFNDLSFCGTRECFLQAESLQRCTDLIETYACDLDWK